MELSVSVMEMMTETTSLSETHGEVIGVKMDISEFLLKMRLVKEHVVFTNFLLFLLSTSSFVEPLFNTIK